MQTTAPPAKSCKYLHRKGCFNSLGTSECCDLFYSVFLFDHLVLCFNDILCLSVLPKIPSCDCLTKMQQHHVGRDNVTGFVSSDECLLNLYACTVCPSECKNLHDLRITCLVCHGVMCFTASRTPSRTPTATTCVAVPTLTTSSVPWP